MSERDRYIPGVPCWVDTVHPDPDAAADFYSALFGWECENTMPEGSPGKYIQARIRGGEVAAIGSVPEGVPPMATWNSYVWVDSADDATAKAVAAGGSVVTEPFDVMDAGRMAMLADPEGAVFCVWQAARHKGARVVNEHGALTFNVLHSRDLEAAATFYGQVFGWEKLNIGSGSMWALAGYGDHLEELTPGLREGMAAMDAPHRFEDVVASMGLISADQPGMPAHWAVTFAVDDALEVAKRAVGLGGTVTMEPTDVPWSRMAVLADPQGASFGISQFVPENRDLG